MVALGENDASFTFHSIDLTGVTTLTAQIGLLPEVTVGGRVEVRLGSPTGEMIGSFEVPLTPESAGFKTYTIDIPPTEATADLVFVFVTETQSEGPNPICAIDWIYFSNAEGRSSR